MSKRLKLYRRKVIVRALKAFDPIFTIEESDLPGASGA